MKYKNSASHGIVERVAFRGDHIEVAVRSHNSVIIAKRGLDEASIEVGEEVLIFLYRLIVTEGNNVHILENKALAEDYIII